MSGGFNWKTSGQQQGKPPPHPPLPGNCSSNRSSKLIARDSAFQTQAVCWHCPMAHSHNKYNNSPRQQMGIGTKAHGTRDRTDLPTLLVYTGYLRTGHLKKNPKLMGKVNHLLGELMSKGIWESHSFQTLF